ncbi:MAG: hypothetical protein Rhirs2KO_11270 [Rhizobiaceae bacterium]
MVEADSRSFQPMNPDHRLGLYRVWEYLDRLVEDARGQEASDWFRSLVRIRNRIAPGHAGVFDQFQTELRDLQLSLTESPNPSYEDIVFSVSRPFAASLLDQLGDERSEVVRQAVRLFLKKSPSDGAKAV